MSKTNNLVTKPYLKQVLRKELGKVKKDLRAEIKASAGSTKKDLRIEMRGIAAQLTHNITTDIKDQMRQDKADILGAVADFGKRVQDLESTTTILTHQVAKLQSA